MSAMLPSCAEVLGSLDGAAAWLGYVATAINDGRLVICPGLNEAAGHELRAEIATLQDAVLPSLRETAKRYRQHAQRMVGA